MYFIFNGLCFSYHLLFRLAILPNSIPRCLRKFQTLLEKIAPTWMNVSIQMKEDPETDKAFGWVLEMWELSLNLINALAHCDFVIIPDFLLLFFGF